MLPVDPELRCSVNTNLGSDAAVLVEQTIVFKWRKRLIVIHTAEDILICRFPIVGRQDIASLGISLRMKFVERKKENITGDVFTCSKKFRTFPAERTVRIGDLNDLVGTVTDLEGQVKREHSLFGGEASALAVTG